MGEAIHCNVNIRVPQSWGTDDDPPWFVTKLREDMYEWVECDAGYTFVEPPTFISWDLSGALNYGSNSDAAASVLAFMREHRIPFIFQEAGHPEWSGSLEIFDGTESIVRTITEDSNVVLDENTWQFMRADHVMDIRLDVIDALGLVREVDAWWAQGRVSINDLSIDHLPEFCPPDPDSRLEISSDDMLAIAIDIERHVLYGRLA